jgi:arsenate reductase (thioredoxin)
MRNILILCTGNSARSLLGEALINHLGAGRLRGYSAGSQPKGQPHPLALDTLREAGIDTAGLSSKSWDAYTGPQAPPLDLVITVCDSAARESCPYFLGPAVKAHWSLPDPPAAGDEAAQRARFRAVLAALRERILALLALPESAWEAPDFGQRVQAIHDQRPRPA